MKKLICVLLTVCMLMLCLVSCKATTYKKALDLIAAGDYEAAYELLEQLGDYKDAKEYLERFRYVPVSTIIKGNSNDAVANMEIIYDQNGLPDKGIEVWGEEEEIDLDFVFDENGRLIRLKDGTLWDYGDGEEYYHTYEYNYDENGQVIKEITIRSDGSKSIEDYAYDKSGNLIEKCYIGMGGDEHLYEYTYDAYGKLIKEIHTRESGLKTITDYTYDDNGKLIKEVQAVKNSRYIVDYSYDINGHLIKEVFTYSNGDKETIDYTYDGNGYLIKKVFSYSDYKDVIDFTCDEHGNPIKVVADFYTKENTYRLVYVPYDLPFGAEAFLEDLFEEMTVDF